MISHEDQINNYDFISRQNPSGEIFKIMLSYDDDGKNQYYTRLFDINLEDERFKKSIYSELNK